MDEKKAKNPLEKLENLVNKLNNVLTKLEDNPSDNEIKEKEKKYIGYLKLYFDNLGLKDTTDETIINSLILFLNLNEKFLKKYSDEFIEKLWALYDYSKFHLNKFEFNNENYLVNFTNLFFLFDEQIFSLGNNLFEDNVEKHTRKLKSVVDRNFWLTEASKLLPPFKDLTHQKNFLIDLFIYKIFSTIDLKPFYVALASFIINTEKSIVLLYKVIALFSLAISQLEKKEDFCDGLFFIVGGVLRAHARSYLKTKGILNESLSFFSGCKKHVRFC